MLALDDGDECSFLKLLDYIELLHEKTALPILVDCEASVRNIYGVEKCLNEIEKQFSDIKGKRINLVKISYRARKIIKSLNKK